MPKIRRLCSNRRCLPVTQLLNQEDLDEDLASDEESPDSAALLLITQTPFSLNIDNGEAEVLSHIRPAADYQLFQRASWGWLVALSQSHASSGNDNSRPLKVVETFTQIYNWQHEHDVDMVKRSLKEGGSEKIGLKAVLGWCKLAHAVSEACVVHNRVCVQFF